MSPEAEFHPEAAAEVEATFACYLLRSDRAAATFVDQLEVAIAQATRWPASGTAYLAETRRLPVRRFPYLLVYREIRGVIRIIAVAHTRRRPGYWTDRS